MIGKIVVDTSVVVKWLVAGEVFNDQAQQLLFDYRDKQIQLFAPALLTYELGNVLIKGKDLPARQVNKSLALFYDLSIGLVHESNSLAALAVELAKTHKLTYYDGSFLALASHLDATLVTDDRKLQVSANGIEIVSLKDYR